MIVGILAARRRACDAARQVDVVIANSIGDVAHRAVGKRKLSAANMQATEALAAKVRTQGVARVRIRGSVLSRGWS